MMYNGWNERQVIIELECIADDFRENGIEDIALSIEDVASELDRAFINNDVYVECFPVLAQGIVEADSADMYGAGDTLMDILMALKTEWGIDIDD